MENKPTQIKYAEFPLKDGFLLTINYGEWALHSALLVDYITYKKKNYKIVKRHHNLDDGTYIFIVEEQK